jgi:protein-S-isoprenylcysteine O-methyltransferase Ste14
VGIGLGVFLVVVGAILVFGVNASVAGLDLTAIGYILMGAGLLVIILSLLVFMPRTRRARRTAITTDAQGRQVVTERDDRISGL